MLSLADILGLLGSVLFIGAFAYVNVGRTLNKRAYNAINLVGSVLLLISLHEHFNLAATLLESAWGLVALFGLIKAFMSKDPESV